jgi:hypothetical protein
MRRGAVFVDEDDTPSLEPERVHRDREDLFEAARGPAGLGDRRHHALQQSHLALSAQVRLCASIGHGPSKQGFPSQHRRQALSA